MGKDEETKPQAGETQDEDQDVEGHNIFATHDYYVQRNQDRRVEVDRDVRDRARAREAEEAKRQKRR